MNRAGLRSVLTSDPTTWMLRVAGLLALFVVLSTLIARAANLPESAYQRAVIAAALTGKIETAVLLVATVIAWLAAGKRLPGGRYCWRSFDETGLLRWLCAATSAMLAWEFSTYAYNYYFDRIHLADRALLVLLFALQFWRPLFLVPFLLTASILIGQFNHPLHGYIPAVNDHLLDVLTIVVAGFIWGVIIGKSVTKEILFLIFCRVAANYWVPGIGKVRMGFTDFDHLHYIVAGAWAHGWLGWMPPESVADLAARIRPLDRPLEIATLLIECGVLLLLWRRRIAAVLLIGAIAFHFGVFALMGYCFWKWTILNGVMLWIVIRRPIDLFDTPHVAVRLAASLLLIGGATLWCKPPQLKWFHTPLANTWRIQAVYGGGEVVELDSRYFAPYHDTFTMNRFSYLSHQPEVTNPYGVTSGPSRTRRLLQAETAEEIMAVEEKVGSVRYRKPRAVTFEKFVKRFISHKQKKNQRIAHSCLFTPPLFWTARRGSAAALPENIREIKVIRYRTILAAGRLTDRPVETCLHVRLKTNWPD